MNTSNSPQQHSTLPLFSTTGVTAMSEPLAWRKGTPVSREQFHAHVQEVANSLPDNTYVINLCDDRYSFMVAFTAALVAGQTNLLPHSRINSVVESVIEDYPDSYCLADSPIEDLNRPLHILPDVNTNALTSKSDIPEIPVNHVAAIAFTSGSTGKPRPNPKTWGQLVAGAELAQRRFTINNKTRLVVTVPPQHMYGLETSILLPLMSGACVHTGRPFYPEDIRLALEEFSNVTDTNKVLVTTPVHLKACVKAELNWPGLGFIISATAPLDKELALRAEKLFDARVLEIFGCTEAGSIASRRTIDGDSWLPYDGMYVEQINGESYISGAYLSEPTLLNDYIEIENDSRFRLLGRHSDIVNIAGKRASLADLNSKLIEIPGINDGVFFNPAEQEDNVTRLTAFVVAPEMDKKQIQIALGKVIDPAFLPRPLHKLDTLPRAATGKIPRTELVQLYQNLSATHE